MNSRILLLLVATWTLPSAADGMRDPTQPLIGREPVAAAGGDERPKLTSVLIAADRRVAVIDGVTVVEGGGHSGIELIEVSATGARIRKDGRMMHLALSGSNMTKERR